MEGTEDKNRLNFLMSEYKEFKSLSSESINQLLGREGLDFNTMSLDELYTKLKTLEADKKQRNDKHGFQTVDNRKNKVLKIIPSTSNPPPSSRTHLNLSRKVPVEPRREVDLVDDVMIPERDPIPEPESPPIGDSDNDPTEDVLEEETELPVPVANGVVWRDVEMYPHQAIRSPTPPPGIQSPMSYTDDDDEEAIRAQFHEVHDISSSDPDSPLPPPATMHVAVHDWIVGQLNAEITVASARIAELRQALTAERATRLGYPGDFRAASPAIACREIDGIELRTRVQMRMTSVGGYIPVVDVEIMITGAMRRVRDLTRSDSD
ncbi:hypothetical protein AgCh_009150 [Apium graveolens]